MGAKLYYAFLQARNPVTVDSSPDELALVEEDIAEWNFVASGQASVKDTEGRLMALKNLRDGMENQGRALKEWTEWEGSWRLAYD